MLVDVPRRAELLDLAAGHHGKPVGHRQRLLLVVRDVDEGDPDLALDALQLDLELAPQLRVERAERLVEQQHRRREHERTRERDALLLPAGELVRPALSERPRRTSSSASATRPRRSAFGDVLEAKAEADVLLDGEVGEERVALEDGVDGPLVRRRLGDVRVADDDAPRVGALEAGDHAQRRRLAAAGRAEQREELAAADLERDVVDGGHVVERLAEPGEHHGLGAKGHG